MVQICEVMCYFQYIMLPVFQAIMCASGGFQLKCLARINYKSGHNLYGVEPKRFPCPKSTVTCNIIMQRLVVQNGSCPCLYK